LLMSRRNFFLVRLSVFLLFSSLPLWAQEKEDRSMIGWDQLYAIINEASGERALQFVQEMVPYVRIRPKQEFEGTFRESTTVARYAKEFGFQNVEIVSLPDSRSTWFASQGELWMEGPRPEKLCDIYDVAAFLASGSPSGEVTAELIDVGNGGKADDYQGKDISGKIVLGSASTFILQRLAMNERGAVGIISYNPIHPEEDSTQVGFQSVFSMAAKDKKPGFGWSVSPQMGRGLAARLAGGEKIRLRSVIQSSSVPGELELVHAVIPGDGSSDQEIAVSAHLFEGYLKQGANDDASGCALTLEMGRTLLRLVAEGKLPKPRRNIHFIWVPEISGTNAWLNKNGETKKRLIADLNFDMEGLRLATNGSYWMMHRTPDTMPTYLNDLGQHFLELVAELNRERVRYRSNSYGFTLPVVAPNGSRDPFYIKVEKYYGASDHAMFLSQGIPALMFITWRDLYYHSSHDLPNVLDSTQLKRAAVVALGVLSTLSSADDPIAVRLAAESMARATERMGEAEKKGLAYLADATDAVKLNKGYREALNTIRHQTEVEKAVVLSSATLFRQPSEGEKKLGSLVALVGQRGEMLKSEVRAFHQLQAGLLQAAVEEPLPGEAEKSASRKIPEPAGGQGEFGGMRGMREGGPSELSAAMRLVPSHMRAELNELMKRKKSILEIRDFLSGEFEPLPLEDLLAYFQAMEKAGRIKMTEKPEEPSPAPTAPPKDKKKAKKGKGKGN
jgi:aminopeptidase YwaD